MSMTVAGHFGTRAQAQSAVKALSDLGIQADHVKSSFAANEMDWNAADPFAAYPGSFSKALDGLAGQAADSGAAKGAGAGIVLAVDSPIPNDRLSAESVMRRCGARSVMQSERSWKDGRWSAAGQAH
jgi:hypothetical protein